MKSAINQIIFILLTCSILLSCTEDNDGSGTLNVRMTDAPYPTDQIAEANITVTKIEIRQSGGNGEEKFTTILDSEVSANLLDLTNGVTANIASVEVPVGSYDLVRVYISEASVVLNDDAETTFNLKIPSGAQSGIKVFINPDIEVVGGLSAELLLDVDVSQSFVPLGSPLAINGFNFKPVIKASNVSFAGRVIGTVTTIVDEMATPISGAQVSIFAADTLNTTSFTNAEGKFEVPGLIAGLYDITVEAEGFTPETETDIEVVVANATTANFELTQE
ncbi:MAG: DUF4382 domain-containing protein [Cyclobacteriaceae bacterium]|nr:DUF4382 domain-containing protein [Cyclobacteriaceae bacterium SS2]